MLCDVRARVFVTEETCKGAADGLYAVSGHCQRYSECLNGSLVRQLRCPSQTYFNRLTSTCSLQVDKTGAMTQCRVARP